MANGAVIALAATVLERDDLISLALLDDLGDDGRTAQGRAAVAEGVAVGVEKHFGKRRLLARLSVQLCDVDHVTFGHLVLFAAGFEDCVCHNSCVPWVGREADRSLAALSWQAEKSSRIEREEFQPGPQGKGLAQGAFPQGTRMGGEFLVKPLPPQKVVRVR